MNRNLFGLGLIAFYSILMVSCKPGAPATPPAAPAVPVNLYQVKPETTSYLDMYPGTLIALNEVQLRSEVNGFLTGIFFTEGQIVKKGQKLYDIERSKYAAAYAQAEANLQIAKANAEKAQKDAERYNRLSQQDAIAKQRVDYAQTDLQNTKLQVSAAQAQLASARTDLQHAVITAPFTGTIGISQVKMGSFVTAGQTQLNTISSDDPISVDFVVSEKEINRFSQLQQKVVAPNDSTFTILLPDNTIYPYPGKISFIDRAVDPQTGTIKIRTSFPNPNRALRSGMSCTIRILNSHDQPQIVIPYKSVTEQMGEYFVYVVETDTARQRKVELGARIRENVIVKNGLQTGAQIVIEGTQKLRDNTPVQVGPPPQPGQNAAGTPASSK
jgi:membrane fusion protein (multidrug efflux system)